MLNKYKGIIITLIAVVMVSLLGLTMGENNKEVDNSINQSNLILHSLEMHEEDDFGYRLSNLDFGEDYNVVFHAKEYRDGVKVNEYEILNLNWSQGEAGIPININYEINDEGGFDLDIKAGPAECHREFDFLNTRSGVAFSTPDDTNKLELNKGINILACSTTNGESVESLNLMEDYSSTNGQDLIISLEVNEIK